MLNYDFTEIKRRYAMHQGQVLDTCVNVCGIKVRFDIDIITDDNEFLPKLGDNSERMRNYLYHSSD